MSGAPVFLEGPIGPLPPPEERGLIPLQRRRRAWISRPHGDSKRDICSGAEIGEVLVFLGNGKGAFSEPRVLFAAPGIEALRTHDLDGDGLDEILCAVPIPGLIALQLKSEEDP